MTLREYLTLVEAIEKDLAGRRIMPERRTGVLALVAGALLRAEFDANKYPKGVKINDARLPAANLTRHAFHGEWNYTISSATHQFVTEN